MIKMKAIISLKQHLVNNSQLYQIMSTPLTVLFGTWQYVRNEKKQMLLSLDEFASKYPKEDVLRMNCICSEINGKMCKEIHDILNFAIWFARMKTDPNDLKIFNDTIHFKTTYDGKWDERTAQNIKLKEDLDISRFNILRYFNLLVSKSEQYGINPKSIRFPAQGERREFCKIHWMLYHINQSRFRNSDNSIKREIPIHNKVREMITDKVYKNEIKNMRSLVVENKLFSVVLCENEININESLVVI